MRRECDDVMHPYAAHPGCDRISGMYREGPWLVYASAQAMNPKERVRVVVTQPAFNPASPDQTKRTIASWLMKLPLKVLTFKP